VGILTIPERCERASTRERIGLARERDVIAGGKKWQDKLIGMKLSTVGEFSPKLWHADAYSTVLRLGSSSNVTHLLVRQFDYSTFRYRA
jgi:hypothetical protein